MIDFEKLTLNLVMAMHKSLFAFCFLLAFSLQAQDMLYHVTTANPMTFNPAFAGSAFGRFGTYKNARFATGFQVRQNGQPFEFGKCVSFDRLSSKLGGAIGFSAEHHSVQNLIKIASFKGIYNYILPINKNLVVKAAIEIGVENKMLDLTNIRFIDMGQNNYFQSVSPIYLDPILTMPRGKNYSSTYLTLGTGVLVESDRIAFGFSLRNLNRPNWAFSSGVIQRKPMMTTLHFQGVILRHEKYDVYFKSLLAYQATQNMLNTGFQLKSKKLMGGLFYNYYSLFQGKQSCAMTSIGYTYNRFLQFRYGLENNLLSKIWAPNHSFSVLVLLNYKSTCTRCWPRIFNKGRYPDLTF